MKTNGFSSRSALPWLLPAILLLSLLAGGCMEKPVEAAAICPGTRGDARVTWKVGMLLPDVSGGPRFEQARALALELVCDLQPGDTIVILRESTFEVVVSEVVPGDPDVLASASKCEDVPVGGPSRECLRVAEANRDLDTWRRTAIDAINALSSSSASAGPCSVSSGWPRDQIVQLLLSLQPEPGTDSYSWLIVAGDADALGDGEPLGAPVRPIHVVVAPYALTCGGPHVEDWFREALAIDLYPAESPPSRFAAFLRAHITTNSTSTSTSTSTGGKR